MAASDDVAEAQRLVSDSQPEDSRLIREHQTSIERKIAFHNLHIAVALGSIAFFLYDVAVDYYSAYFFYLTSQHWYAALAVTFLVLPALLLSCLSGWWYFCGEQRRQCFPSPTRAVRMFRIVCHACFLSPLARLVDSLRCGLKCKSALKEKNVDKFRKYDALLVYEDRDATFLRLLAMYLGMAPQVLVRLTAAAQGTLAVDRREEITPPALWQHAVISLGSVSSLAWVMVAYKVTSDLAQQDNRQRTDWSRKFIYGLGHFFGAYARFIALAIGTAFLPRTFGIGVALHFVAMFAYVRWYHRKETPANPFSWDKDSIKDHAAYLFLAVVHVFTFLNLNHYRTRARYLLYYTLCFLENTALMTCWWCFQDEADARDLEHYLLFWTQMGAFVLGLALLWYSHRCRVLRHKATPHESHVNGLTNEETPLKQDDKEEVCQEVVVVEQAFNQQQLDLQESEPSVVVRETGIEGDDAERLEGLSIVSEEPIKEKVIEIWFNRAPKSADETSTDNSVKSGQHETKVGHNLPCVTEVAANKETASIEAAAKRHSSPYIATLPNIEKAESSSVSQDPDELKRDSEIRLDHPTGDGATAESVAVKVEQAEQQESGQQYEDIEKLLMELNAYEAGIEKPQVPRVESIVQTQQLAGQPEQTEKSESLPANAQQAATIPKQVSEQPQEKTEEESNVGLSTAEPTGHTEEKVVSETHQQPTENLNGTCHSAAESCVNSNSHSPNAVEEVEFSKRTEDEMLEKPLSSKVESVSMPCEKSHQAAESESQLGEAGKSDRGNRQLDPMEETLEIVEVKAIQSAEDQSNDQILISNEAAVQESPQELSESNVENDTQLTVLIPIETDQETRPQDEEIIESKPTEIYQDEAQNSLIVHSTLDNTSPPVGESANDQRETLASSQQETVEQNFPDSEEPQNDKNVQESIEEKVTEAQGPINTSKPVQSIDADQSSSGLEAAVNADVCEDVSSAETESSPDLDPQHQSESIDSQEKGCEEDAFQRETTSSEREIDEASEFLAASEISEAIHEEDASHPYSEPMLSKEQAPTELVELMEDPKQSESINCSLQPVETVSNQEPEESTTVIAEGEVLATLSRESSVLDLEIHYVETGEQVEQVNQDATYEINQSDLTSDTASIEVNEDHLNDEKLTSDENVAHIPMESEVLPTVESPQQATQTRVENEVGETPAVETASEQAAPAAVATEVRESAIDADKNFSTDTQAEFGQSDLALDTAQLGNYKEDEANYDEKPASAVHLYVSQDEPDVVLEVEEVKKHDSETPIVQVAREQATSAVNASDSPVGTLDIGHENFSTATHSEIIHDPLASDIPQLTDLSKDQLVDENLKSNEDLPIAQMELDISLGTGESLQHTLPVAVENEGSEMARIEADNEEASFAVDAASVSQVRESDFTDGNTSAASHAAIGQNGSDSDITHHIYIEEDQLQDEKLKSTEDMSIIQVEDNVLPAGESLLQTVQVPVENQGTETSNSVSLSAQSCYELAHSAISVSDIHVNELEIAHETLSSLPSRAVESGSSESVEQSNLANEAGMVSIVQNIDLSNKESKLAAENLLAALQVMTMTEHDILKTTESPVETTIIDLQNDVQKEPGGETIISSSALTQENLYVDTLEDERIKEPVEGKPSHEELLEDGASQESKLSEEPMAAITCVGSSKGDCTVEPQAVSVVKDSLMSAANTETDCIDQEQSLEVILPATAPTSVSDELNHVEMCDSTVEPKAISNAHDPLIHLTSTSIPVIQDHALEAVLPEEGNLLVNLIIPVEESQKSTSPDTTDAITTTEPEQGRNVQQNPICQDSDSEINTSVSHLETIKVLDDDVANEIIVETSKLVAPVIDLEETSSNHSAGIDLTQSENTASYIASNNDTTEDTDTDINNKNLENASRAVPDEELSKLKETYKNTSATHPAKEQELANIEEGELRNTTEKLSPAASREERRSKFQSKIPRKKP